MSYIALARKWRPQTFSQLLGQKHLTQALINSLDKQRIHHAYLFTGTRGVGKTSVARLLAKSLSCEVGVSSNPCLECSACIAFAENRFIDLIEIDGASKTKVEDTREILENVQYAPTSGRFKIYLIDEVHMLSQHSFNALLKTLEEPPEHVKFLLATTDPQKLPVTVLSRCLQFNLKHISSTTITKHLEHILTTEEKEFELESLVLLSRAAMGSMRDALSLLDQAIVGCNDSITCNDVKDLLGYTQHDYALQIIQALLNNNPEQLITISRQINSDGGLFSYVVDEIIGYLHQIAIKQALPNTSSLQVENIDITNLSNKLKPQDTQLMYQIALRGREDMLLAPSIVIGFEILILRMNTFLPTNKQESLSKKSSLQPIVTSNQQSQSHKVDMKANKIIDSTTKNNGPISKESSLAANSYQAKQPQSAKSEDDIAWAKIIPQLNLQGLTLTAAENSNAINKSSGIITLRLDAAHQSIFTTAVTDILEKALSKFYAEKINIKLEYGELTTPSPATQKEDTLKANIGNATQALQEDQFFKQLQDEFSAELIKNSIASLKDDI
jgi:DNA polymerase III subunit gamma/tau